MDPPTCNLCTHTPYLFIVSVGGRTGSTTILNMLNAHPNIKLAGENNGQMTKTVQMWSEAAGSNYANDGASAFERGKFQPMDMLCSLVSYWNLSMTPFIEGPSPRMLVRGFKEIRWTNMTIAMLDVLFPCNRKIFSVRLNESAQAESKVCLARLGEGPGYTPGQT